MARPKKKGIDYFSHDTKHGSELEYIEALHGLNGYAIYFKLLERIYFENGYFLTWDKRSKTLFAKQVGIEIKDIETIVFDMIAEGLFSEKMYSAHKILTSSGIQKRYIQAIKKRSGGEINFLFNIISDDENNQKETKKGFSQQKQGFSTPETELLTPESTQSKVKYSKVKESISSTNARTRDTNNNFKNQIIDDQIFIENTCLSLKITPEKIPKFLTEFVQQKTALGEKWKDYNDFKKNFYFWISKKLAYARPNQKESRNRKHIDDSKYDRYRKNA